MCMYMNDAFFLIEPSSTPSSQLYVTKSSHKSESLHELLTQSVVSGKSSTSVLEHVMCIRVYVCLYHDLVFVLKGTWMCNQCYSTWKCVYYVLHMVFV